VSADGEGDQMNSYSELQFAQSTEVYRAWQIPEAESVSVKDNSAFRPAAVAVALGLLFGVVLATAVGNFNVPASPAPDLQADSNAAVLKAPHRPRTFQVIPAPPVPLASSRESRLAERPKIPFVIEGDETVADFDSASGTIQTDGGKTFLIGISTDAKIAGPWQDYHRNVHYRCDQSGNCTIKGAGVVVPNAKLT
jgi:hypothetical protein